MNFVTDEYRNLRAFLLEPPSSPMPWAQAQARWRKSHPNIERLLRAEAEEITRLFAAYAPPICSDNVESQE